MKIQMEQLDLLAPWPTFALREGYHAVRVLVRLGTLPIGDVYLRPVRKRIVAHDRLRRRIARKYGPAVLKALAVEPTCKVEEILVPQGVPHDVRDAFVQSHEAEQARSWPEVTVAVHTRDREHLLAACLCNLKQLDYTEFEILVLDNSRDPVPTREIAEKLGVRYVRCSAQGPGRARNAAIEHAHADWIAFIDDDCRAARTWLKELVRPTHDSGCRCVCGPALAARLESTADIAFELYGGLAPGYAPRVLTADTLTASATRPAPLARFGHAANFLIHKPFAKLAGGFDVDLPCGEHVDLLHRALEADYTVRYAPRAIVYHHRTWTRKTLRKWIRIAAAATAAYHARRALACGDYRSLLELVWHRPLSLSRDFARAITGKSKYPWSLIGLEMRGTLAGPWEYAARMVRRRLKADKPQAVKRPVPVNGSPAGAAGDAPAKAVEQTAPPRNPSNRAA